MTKHQSLPVDMSIKFNALKGQIQQEFFLKVGLEDPLIKNLTIEPIQK